jgi:hypothetical protein
LRFSDHGISCKRLPRAKGEENSSCLPLLSARECNMIDPRVPRNAHPTPPHANMWHNHTETTLKEKNVGLSDLQ